MELFIALALFIGLIVAWIMLPGSTSTPVIVERESSSEGMTAHQPA
jgi:hypothetical protein